MRKSNKETFITIKTEGALLPADLLQRIADGDRDLEGLSPESYHLSKNEKINEVINRAWNRCVATWKSFYTATETLPTSDAGTTLTRERWLLILFQELGYGRLLTAKAHEIGGKTYPISHSWNNTPIHLVSFRQDLDSRTPGLAGAARLSPHSFVQEFLNRSDSHLWGIVSNGLRLRILRDNSSLTRQAFLEFDLEAMMNGEVYSDFILLFLLLHQSRVEAEKPEDFWLERWSQEARKRGTRALDQLRKGVEEAIASLGQGFIAHPANRELRQRLQSGILSAHELYQHLLRLVYRLIFLFVAEDRELLLQPDATAEERQRYLEHYSLSRIRRLAGRLRGTRHGDLWQALRITFSCLNKGQPALGLAPLGSFLFSDEALSSLNNCELANDSLLTALRHLCFTTDNKILRAVDYRNMGTEELGSVYESLLELHPRVNLDASTFELKAAAGSERKTTGSYYTPSSLINCLLDSALEPVIARALKEPDPEKALLNLNIVDPACGSGHFLIAAAHRIGRHLAALRTGESEPPPEKRRQALRDVVSRCIYGVDINPLAVELCKVALWIETLNPGLPLGFLDHHIKCGNSLIGATPELLEKGIPDDAFKPLERDDRDVASSIRRKNRLERAGIQDLLAVSQEISQWQKTIDDFQDIVDLPEGAVQEVHEKEALYVSLREEPAFIHLCQVADLWTAAFFWPLTKATSDKVPTHDIFLRFQKGSYRLREGVLSIMDDLGNKHRFFHWHLEFPEVFTETGKGGFDCVLGNPPWERIKLQEKEFFDQRDPEIANAPNAAARKRLIDNLLQTNPGLRKEFIEAKRSSECESHFLRASGKYTLSAVGDINTYQIFAGLSRQLIFGQGRAGIIVPSGIATDDTNKQFFADLTEKQALVSLYDFENREGIFPSVHRSYKFCLLSIGGTNAAPRGADFAFFLTNVSQLKEDDRHFSLSAEEIALLNPNTRTCPIFRSKGDAEITKAIYRRVPVLIDESKGEDGNPWGLKFMTMFHMANDSHLFGTREQLENEGWKLVHNIFYKENKKFLPLYEAKMMHHYDHRWATFEGMETRDLTSAERNDPNFVVLPRYWVSATEVEARLRGKWSHPWLLSYRSICRTTDERSVISAILPISGAGHSLFFIISLYTSTTELLVLYAGFISYVFDFITRQKVGGMNFSFFMIEQLPFLSPIKYNIFVPWARRLTWNQWVIIYILELTYTAWDLESLANDCGYYLPPFRWDEERRFLIRCELDAAYFHLYLPTTADGQWKTASVAEGSRCDETPEELAELKRHFPTPRNAVAYILDTFPIVHRKDMEKYGEYRTKRMILECYDEMARAMREDVAGLSAGRESTARYEMHLNPHPGPPIDSKGNFIHMYQWDRGNWPDHIHTRHPSWNEPVLSAWFDVCQKRWKYLEDDRIFPWDGREAFIFALIPYLVQEKPKEKFEFYRDAALLASCPDRLEALLLNAELSNEYHQVMQNIGWLQFPDGYKIRPRMIRENLQNKQIIQTDVKSGATTVHSSAKLPPLPNELKPLIPLILKAADNLDKMQRRALEKAEAAKLTFTADEINIELKAFMVA